MEFKEVKKLAGGYTASTQQCDINERKPVCHSYCVYTPQQSFNAEVAFPNRGSPLTVSEEMRT
jgi:hypothetical protein